jgi:hypothetical protein
LDKPLPYLSKGHFMNLQPIIETREEPSFANLQKLAKLIFDFNNNKKDETV